jgi:hypothetical protein
LFDIENPPVSRKLAQQEFNVDGRFARLFACAVIPAAENFFAHTVLPSSRFVSFSLISEDSSIGSDDDRADGLDVRLLAGVPRDEPGSEREAHRSFR